jgi:uncharacterized protein YbjQ (UPF0145 family)
MGGESVDITRLVKDGRDAALHRLESEARELGAVGVTGVASELTSFAGNLEFLSTGSAVHARAAFSNFFTTSFDGKEMYCMLDAGYTPRRFAFGNIAYSVGLGGAVMGSLKTLVRGEISEYSNILNRTRHTALARLVADAKSAGANALVGVEIDLLPFGDGYHEMLMSGTAATHPALPAGDVVSCELTCDELWSMAKMGYAPVKIVMATAVYSLGVVGGFLAALKSIRKGEVSELTSMVYDAREHALDMLEKEARDAGAEMVMGTDVYIHELGGGLVEFMAVGTAVKKSAGIAPQSESLPVQAVAAHRRTFRNSVDSMLAGANQTE